MIRIIFDHEGINATAVPSVIVMFLLEDIQFQCQLAPVPTVNMAVLDSVTLFKVGS